MLHFPRHSTTKNRYIGHKVRGAITSKDPKLRRATRVTTELRNQTHGLDEVLKGNSKRKIKLLSKRESKLRKFALNDNDEDCTIEVKEIRDDYSDEDLNSELSDKNDEKPGDDQLHEMQFGCHVQGTQLTRKQRLREIISKSKLFKAEKKKVAENQKYLLACADKEWNNVIPNLSFISRTNTPGHKAEKIYQEEVDEFSDLRSTSEKKRDEDFDRLLQELQTSVLGKVHLRQSMPRDAEQERQFEVMVAAKKEAQLTSFLKQLDCNNTSDDTDVVVTTESYDSNDDEEDNNNNSEFGAEDGADD